MASIGTTNLIITLLFILEVACPVVPANRLVSIAFEAQ